MRCRPMADIIVDTREPVAIIEELEKLGRTVDRQQLDVSDFMMFDVNGSPSLVSRKASDLFQSIFSGHFADELNRCMNFIESFGMGGKLFWLQEGEWSTGYPTGGKGGMKYYKRAGPDYFRSSDNSHRGASEKVYGNVQLSLQAAGLWFVSTGTLHETALMLNAIYERGMQGWPSRMTSALKRPELKWGDDSRAQRLMALWPHLKEASAVTLLDKYTTIGTLVSMMRAGDGKELLKIEGIGKKGIENFEEAIS